MFCAYFETFDASAHSKPRFGVVYGPVESSFKSQPGQNGTVNGDCYQTMIMNCLLYEIEARDFNKFWCDNDNDKSCVIRVLYSHSPKLDYQNHIEYSRGQHLNYAIDCSFQPQ